MRYCRKCGHTRSALRLESVREAVYGLWTCEHCGEVLNYRGELQAPEKEADHKHRVVGEMVGLALATLIGATGIFILGLGRGLALFVTLAVSTFVFLMAHSMSR